MVDEDDDDVRRRQRRRRHRQDLRRRNRVHRRRVIHSEHQSIRKRFGQYVLTQTMIYFTLVITTLITCCLFMNCNWLIIDIVTSSFITIVLCSIVGVIAVWIEFDLSIPDSYESTACMVCALFNLTMLIILVQVWLFVLLSLALHSNERTRNRWLPMLVCSMVLESISLYVSLFYQYLLFIRVESVCSVFQWLKYNAL